MPTLTSEDLLTIERDADRAPVQQLRQHVTQVTQGLLSLEPDTADHARALLLKLERLIDEQCVCSVGTGTSVHGPKFRADTADAARVLVASPRVAA